jgi:hypothetical protein
MRAPTCIKDVQKLTGCMAALNRFISKLGERGLPFFKLPVITNYPLSDILRNQDATGRISKWAVELGALNIDFKPRTAIKSQALVNFMAEWWENQLPTPTERPEHWVMYFDGSLKLEGAGAGVLLISPTGEQLKYVLQIFWKVSNNEPSTKFYYTGSASQLP